MAEQDRRVAYPKASPCRSIMVRLKLSSEPSIPFTIQYFMSLFFGLQKVRNFLPLTSKSQAWLSTLTSKPNIQIKLTNSCSNLTGKGSVSHSMILNSVFALPSSAVCHFGHFCGSVERPAARQRHRAQVGRLLNVALPLLMLPGPAVTGPLNVAHPPPPDCPPGTPPPKTPVPLTVAAPATVASTSTCCCLRVCPGCRSLTLLPLKLSPPAARTRPPPSWPRRGSQLGPHR